MFRLVFNVESSAMAEMIRRKSTTLLEALINKMNVLLIALQAKIAGEKLQGEVLHHRTGTLAGSVHTEPVEVTSSEITGFVSAAGGPAWYGFIHEKGGEKAYTILPVNKQALRFIIGGEAVFARRVIHPPLPKRSFMLSTIVEMRDALIAGMNDTARQVLEG